MSLKRTFWTGLGSYAYLVSATLVTLVSVPVALHFLTTEEFGLWTFALQAVGYLMLLDFGVSNSIGRLMAEPLLGGVKDHADRWFSVHVIVLLSQAAMLVAIGLPLVGIAVHWFGIPPHLQAAARSLLICLIFSYAARHPFQICTGILFSQNRFYWVSLTGIITTWAGFAVFVVCLLAGFRSLAYGLSMLATVPINNALLVLAIRCGPHRLRLVPVGIWSEELRQLLSFSSGIFLIGIATQVVLMSQSLILTKMVGLAAAASFNVSSKAGLLLLQILWRPFDAFVPRWQEMHVSKLASGLLKEFVAGVRLTAGVTIFAVICLLALNKPFVIHWAKQGLYCGRGFDFLLCLFVVVQMINHCVSYPFFLCKHTTRLAVNAILEAAFNIGLSVFAVKRFGISGLLMASVLCSVVFSTCWICFRAPRYIGGRFLDIAKGSAGILPLMLLFSAASAYYLSTAGSSSPLPVDIAVALLAAIVLAGVFRPELVSLLRQLQKRRSITSSGGPV